MRAPMNNSFRMGGTPFGRLLTSTSSRLFSRQRALRGDGLWNRPRATRGLLVAITCIACALCLFSIDTAYASPTVRTISRGSEVKFSVSTLDKDGNLLKAAMVTSWFVDEIGQRYKCANPNLEYEDGIHALFPISYYMPEESLRYCACAELWCDEHLDEDAREPTSQVMIWNRLAKDGVFDDHDGRRWRATSYDTDTSTKEFERWYAEHADEYEYGGDWALTFVGDTKTQPLVYLWAKKKHGTVSVQKTSAMPALTSNDSRYTLAGAHYAIYADEACTQRVPDIEDLVTNDQGTTNVVDIEAGTYWIKETVAPAGYELDDASHEIRVAYDQQNVITLSDYPTAREAKPLVNKHDLLLGRIAQGDATLAGAQFLVRYFPGTYELATLPTRPMLSWTFRSDDDGSVIADESHKVDGDELVTRADGTVIFPLGTYTIQETKAPEGYHLEGWKPGAVPSYQAPMHLVVIDVAQEYEPQTIDDEVIRGGVRLQKIDAEMQRRPQGDADLENTTFDVLLDGPQPVNIDGNTYQPGDVVKTLKTDDKGSAQTGSRELPYGSYVVRETGHPEGYLTNETYEESFQIREDGVIVNLADRPCIDYVCRGGLRIAKVSRETSQPCNQGSAQIEGAVFAVTLESEQPVMVNGAPHRHGDIVCTLSCDHNGIAETTESFLPYGTYTVREIEAPEGFLVNDEWSQTFCIRENGEMKTYDTPETRTEEQVIRGGMKFVKRDGTSGETLAGIPFAITSATTGERHVIVSDEHGVVDTESVPHDSHTNQNDTAVGTGNVVNSDLLDANNGIWFHGDKKREAKVSNDLGALPYDTYTVEELPVATNSRYQLRTFSVRITKPGEVIDLGYVDNTPNVRHDPRIGTTLTHGGTGHVAPCDQEVTLVDEVSFEGLTPKESYRLEGILVDRESGKPLTNAIGEPVTASTSFVPQSPTGSQRVTFVLDTTHLQGKSIVAEERLFLDGKEVAKHDDHDDASQTVFVPSLATTLGESDPSSEDDANLLTLVDKVTVSDVDPGRTYEVSGILMDKETGEPYADSASRTARGLTTFVAKNSTETIDVEFSIDRNDASGKELVAFEELSCQGVRLAAHEDLNSAEQTVRVITLRTSLADRDGRSVVSSRDKIELIDSVSYAGLNPGTTYRLKGQLMDQSTGEPIRDGSGNAIAETCEFTPTASEGTQDVTFKCDASVLAGHVAVAFETLMRDDTRIAYHTDLDSETQTVFVPEIGTTLTTNKGAHEQSPAESVSLTDTVAYRGLQPGKTYCLSGTLMDSDTKQAANDANGSPIQGNACFTPDAPDGIVEVTFQLDTTPLDGHRLVAFERLLEDNEQGRLVASHEDWDDEQQSVWITSSQKGSNPTKRTSGTQSAEQQQKNQKLASTGDAALSPLLVLLGGITVLIIAKIKLI